MAKQEYEHVGSRRIDVYRPKPKKQKFDWEALFGGLFLLVILLAVLSNCAG